nr:MAG TPA: hypothetical protein [Caudoviricetes sp.]
MNEIDRVEAEINKLVAENDFPVEVLQPATKEWLSE